MDAARRAGMNAAQNATITVVTGHHGKMPSGRSGVTPGSTLRIQRPPPSAIAIPIARPSIVRVSA